MSGVGAIDLQRSLETAFEAYRAGRHAEASLALAPVLTAIPGETAALNLQGAIKLAQGDATGACEAFGRAARTHPQNPEIQNNLGSALRRAGRCREAESAYRIAIAVRPDYAEAHYNLGNLLVESGRDDEAAAAYRRAIGIRADYLPAYLALGQTLERSGNWSRAEEAYRLALAAAPTAARAHFGLGRTVDRGGPPSAAGLEHLATARRLAPDDAEIANAYGVALTRKGRVEEAYAAFQDAVARDPRFGDAHVNLANLLVERGECERARVHYGEALEVAPTCVEALIGLGNIAGRDGATAEAETIYRRALAVDPDCAPAHSNLGVALAAVGRHDAALTSFRRALALDPDYADAHANLGHALIGKGAWAEALAALDRALTLMPDHVEARINRATARLLTGDFAGGWRDYLARDARQPVGIGVHRRRLSADLSAHRLLVLADQGLGDELFFLRFAPALRARGASVAYRASPKIAAMVERSGAADRVVCDPSEPVDATLTLSVGDLPHLLGMAGVAEIPPPLPLPPRAEVRTAVVERLSHLGAPPYIGVTWRAGTKIHRNGLYKEVPRAALAAALARVPGTLIALQRHPADGEVAAFAQETGRAVHDLTAINESLEDMLALVSALDDYVCVSNTNVHLRAGTGRASRVLMPHPPEFRWMAEGDESPWFPGTRIYRQAPTGDWSAALTRLKDDLS
jgi:Flp pilus assembly protein TadD